MSLLFPNTCYMYNEMCYKATAQYLVYTSITYIFPYLVDIFSLPKHLIKIIESSSY